MIVIDYGPSTRSRWRRVGMGKGDERLGVSSVVGTLSLSYYTSVDSFPIYRAAEKVAENTEKKFRTLSQENQQLRTTIQGIRLGAQNEVKRFKKE